MRTIRELLQLVKEYYEGNRQILGLCGCVARMTAEGVIGWKEELFIMDYMRVYKPKTEPLTNGYWWPSWNAEIGRYQNPRNYRIEFLDTLIAKLQPEQKGDTA